MLRNFRINLMVLLGALGVSLLAAEGIVRLQGYEPEKFQTVDLQEPVTNEQDPMLGWKSKPGNYVMPPYGPEGVETKLTIWPDRTRATASEQQPKPDKILLFGGSVTLGQGVSDEETFAWRLQQRFPDVEILNFGMAGYGTYQSYLLLEEYLRKHPEPPELVLYNLILHHEDRNYGQWWWHKHLKSYSQRNHIAAPYSDITEDGRFIRMPPESYPDWPGDRFSALLTLIKDTWMQKKNRKTIRERRRLNLVILKLMDHLCRQHGVEFGVVLLHMRPEVTGYYQDRLDRLKIGFLNCVNEGWQHPANHVPGDPVHPNGRIHAKWADCIEGGIHGKVQAMFKRENVHDVDT